MRVISKSNISNSKILNANVNESDGKLGFKWLTLLLILGVQKVLNLQSHRK